MELLNNTTFAALIIGGFIGFFIGRGFAGYTDEERNYFRDEASQKYIENLSSDGLAKVSEALSRNRKVEAIKFFREDTGLGLKESKDAIEFLLSYGPPG